VQHHRDILAAVRARNVPLAQQRIDEHFHNLEHRIAQATSRAEQPPAGDV
jgi:DNA-binding GntR family transcriptional regulator